MFDIKNKQYIIRQGSGKTINLYYKENSGICMRQMGKEGTWLDPAVVIHDSLPGFSAASDDSDNIHLLCQDRYGNIIYWLYNGKVWSSKTILRSRTQNRYNKHLTVVCTRSAVMLFYVVRYSGNQLLSYQTINKYGILAKPRVIDYVQSTEMPYQVAADDKELQVFYQIMNEKYNQSGYRRYNAESDLWDEFVPISEYGSDTTILSAAIDSRKQIHACWQKHENHGYSLYYSCKASSQNSWNAEKLLATSPNQFYNMKLVALPEHILAYWVNEDTITYCELGDERNAWSVPKKYIFNSEDNQLYCIDCNIFREKEHQPPLRAVLPGSINSSYQLAFAGDKPQAGNRLEPDDPGISPADSLNRISLSIKELKASLCEIQQRINDLESTQKKHELLLEKNETQQVSAYSVSPGHTKEIPDRKLPSADEAHKKTSESQSNPSQKPSHEENAPIMPGIGFSNITPEYLRSLAKK